MDKILIIDFMNAVYRASISFGSKVPHEECLYCDNNKHQSDTHCKCNAPWDVNGAFCYGVKFNLIFNFFRNLRPLIELFSPDKCFLVGEGHPQFRYDIYPEYKANRRIVKEASKQAVKDKVLADAEVIIKLMRHLPITIARAANFEADDTIGSLAENMKDEDITVLSGDTDYIQLLQRGYKNIKIYSPIKKEFMEAPEQFYIQSKSILGDKSDHIPALLTPKKAEAVINDPLLFEKFMSVEENRANFSINRKLIQFADVPEEEIILTEGVKNFPQLRREFANMKFDSMTNMVSWEKYCKTFDCIKY